MNTYIKIKPILRTDIVAYEELPEDFADMPRNDYKYEAKCDSDACRSIRRSGARGTGKRSNSGVVKHVAITADVCPDCANYLHWSRS